jgi:hypothetical protein
LCCLEVREHLCDKLAGDGQALVKRDDVKGDVEMVQLGLSGSARYGQNPGQSRLRRVV